MEIRAFLNGNLHIKFNQQFMLALNVEVGRLLGWSHTAQEAAHDLNEEVNEIMGYFKTCYSALPYTINQL